MSVKYFQQEAFPWMKRWCAHFFASVSFLLACAVFLTIICWKSPVLLFCLLAGGLATALIQQVGQQTGLPKHWIVLLQTLVVAVILSFFWIDSFSSPAAAQFFGKAETFFNRSFPGGATAVALVFNVLRAIFLLYIAVSLVGVISAVRKDEDWQVVARTPLLVVIAVTIADVMTSFVIG